jgi:hypothetical protein
VTTAANLLHDQLKDVGRSKTARRIVHQNRRDARFENRQPGRHRFVTRLSADHNRKRAVRRTESSLGRFTSGRLETCRSNHYDLNGLGENAQCAHGAFQQRPAGQIDECLGQIAAQPNTSAGGNNNHRNGALGA